jgi:hypothetical protein
LHFRVVIHQLQQYRKKKDNKGRNSNSGNNRGKSSNKSTDSEAASTASSDQLDPNLASGNEVGEHLREDPEEVSVNPANDQQVPLLQITIFILTKS